MYNYTLVAAMMLVEKAESEGNERLPNVMLAGVQIKDDLSQQDLQTHCSLASLLSKYRKEFHETLHLEFSCCTEDSPMA